MIFFARGPPYGDVYAQRDKEVTSIHLPILLCGNIPTTPITLTNGNIPVTIIKPHISSIFLDDLLTPPPLPHLS